MVFHVVPTNHGDQIGSSETVLTGLMACFVSATKAISRGYLGKREHGFIELINLWECRRITSRG
jgi:hypothetical protein